MNAQVLQGPYLTNKVVGVLLRFREEPVTLMAFIEAMYHQLKVHPGDVHTYDGSPKASTGNSRPFPELGSVLVYGFTRE